MRCPVLVGRERELSMIAAAVQAAAAGSGAWVTIVGEAGVGKTRLVAEAAERAASGGASVAVGRCSDADRLTPFRPVAELLLSAARGRDRPREPGLAGHVAALGGMVPHWGDGGSRSMAVSPAVLGESVLQVLAWLAGDGAQIAVLEDLHWADEETLAVCQYMSAHLDGLPVSVLATLRSGEGTRAGALLPWMYQRVVLAPLGGGEVAAMATACLGGPPAAGLLPWLSAAASGLPLLVEDLLSSDAHVSDRFERLVSRRLEQLTDVARRALTAAALLGDEVVDPSMIADLLEISREETFRALRAAADLDILMPGEPDGYVFRHALTRDVVLAPGRGDHRSVARRAATLLERRGDPRRLACAADLWERAGDRERASGLWARAAQAAAAAGAPGSAGTAWRRAVDAAAPSARVDMQLGLLTHLAQHGPVDEGIALGGRLLDDTAHRPGTEHRVRLLLARCCLAAGRLDEAGLTIPSPSDGAGRDAQDAEVLILQATLALQLGGGARRSEAEQLARRAADLAHEQGWAEVACHALEVVSRCARSRSLEEASGLLRRALHEATSAGSSGWRLRLLNELGTVEMLATATGSRLARAREAAVEAGALDVMAGIDLNLASLQAMRGELDLARESARRARGQASRLGITPIVAAATAIEAVTAGLRGRPDVCEGLLRQAEALSPHDRDLSAFCWGVGRGFAALVREERDDALMALRRAVEVDTPVGVLDTARGPLVVTLAADGVDARAEQAAAEAAATPGACWSELWVGFGRAAVAGAAGLPDQAMTAFVTADAAARHYPLFRAVGLRLLAEAALRDGWGYPVDWLRGAEATFVAGGQDRAAGACRALLQRAGVAVPRRRGEDRRLPDRLLRLGVTAREADILDLVGERLPNRDIAARLYLSPRTVEKHVAALLSKFGVSDRTALIQRARTP